MVDKFHFVLGKYKIKIWPFVVMFLFFIFPINVNGQSEFINSFNAIISVNTDNSINVTEVIEYDSGSQEKHGIYRDIYPYSSSGKRINISNIAVTDEKDIPYPWQTYREGKYIRIRIGDPDLTFQGKKIYKIQYHANRAVSHFDSYDEIYWNTTGNNWPFSINSATAMVELPSGANIKQSACYYGVAGISESCNINNSSQASNILSFSSPRVFSPSEGMTIAIGFEKGVVSEYSKFENAVYFLQEYWSWIVGAALILWSLISIVIRWYRYGRDPKGTGVIVPQYDVPDGLTPIEVAGIMNRRIDSTNVSSQIIYLAINGYITIKAIEQKILGLIPKRDYELTLNKEFHNINDIDRELLQKIFVVSVVGTSVKMSDLQQRFYTAISELNKIVMDTLHQKEYYKSTKHDILQKKYLISGAIVLVFAFIVNARILIVGIIFLLITHFLSKTFTAKTQKGVETKEYILGLKDYLQIAEKDRLEFHNTPEKKPEVFEKLLPYAMVLGVEKAWAKEFEGIYVTPPTWYITSDLTNFNALSLSNSLSGFKSYALGAFGKSSGASGSGGGGSSGGGGGGGGGGSW